MISNIVNINTETKEQLDNLAWEEFLKHKRNNRKNSYNLRRRCVLCKTPIQDDSPNEYCKECANKELVRIIKDTYPKKQEGNKAESKFHFELKDTAKVFLEKMGCVNIVYEKKLGKVNKSVEIDVYGEIGSLRIGVECGSNRITKLQRASRYLDIIYIWPFNETEPYKWDESIRLCGNCGHKMGIVKLYTRY